MAIELESFDELIQAKQELEAKLRQHYAKTVEGNQVELEEDYFWDTKVPTKRFITVNDTAYFYDNYFTQVVEEEVLTIPYVDLYSDVVTYLQKCHDEVSEKYNTEDSLQTLRNARIDALALKIATPPTTDFDDADVG